VPEDDDYSQGADADRPTDRMRVGPTSETARVDPSQSDDGNGNSTPVDAQQTLRISDAPLVFPAESPAHTFGSGGTFEPPTVPANSAEGGSRSGWSRRRGYLFAGIGVGVLALLYGSDLAFSSGEVPRGTVVGNVAVGGLDKAAAERKLHDQLDPGLREPIVLTAGDRRTALSPEQAGLNIEWAATLDQAGSQPLNPVTRFTSLFTTRQVAPVTQVDRTRLTRALEQAKPALERAPTEGTIRFEGTRPIAVEPVAGRTINIPGATDAVLANWVSGKSIGVPFTEQPVRTTSQGVHQALTAVAEPAVSAPVTVHGDHVDATLTPEAVASALHFEPDGRGGLKSRIDIPTAVAAVQPQLAETVHPGQDARIVLEGGAPVVHPSVDGREIDWNKSFEHLADVVTQRGDRSVRAMYVAQPAKFTTDQANGLGIHEAVSEFSTGGFEPASGVNIRRVAEQVNGAIVKPGETFSLNGHTGPRGIPQGYVESGVIEDGHPARDVGGGISQFATTLFNAEYFAGMKDVEHKEHSFYISRYPAGREATVFQGPNGSSIIDVKFKNTSNSGILIQTEWTPSSITVRFWGTKQYDVTSQTSPRSAPTPPQPMTLPPGQPCSPTAGEPGFTVYDTRTIRDRANGQVTTEPPSRTVYDPEPIISCPPP
jgi:vancomycin resistance protein YoaR